jgi:predicted ATPase/class 3 adenylate cyclase
VPRELPTGTVTFVFTDIEGSTRLLERLGGEYEAALAEHRRLLRDAFDRNGGVEVDTQGDAFFVAFPSAKAAVLAAADAGRGLANTDVRVRIGLHSGEAAVAEEGYVGMDVHRAARICSAAHGGQVVLSQTTRELVEEALPDQLALRDLGEHRLKDLTRPQRLHQLVGDGLQNEFPPLRTLEQRPTNLPIQHTPLIGRDRELADARSLLAGTRLLTLTGPGGIGKTRLAIQIAADALDDYADGVFVVDLADLADPALVIPAVAQTIGVKERASLALRDVVTDYVGSKRILVVLDNMERLVDAAPELAACFASAPEAKLIATSRVALRVAGEQEYPVPSLLSAAAVELFVERARAIRPEFALDGNRSAIEEICRRLDSLPLAIELAAARVKLLPPQKLLERLEQRLPLLTGGARDAPARHQTLRATIEWSFDLLDEEEQRLLASLSVFAGGFTVEAAEAVCDATIDGLASLVDKSLVTERERTGGEPRFSMLETVAEYARGRLEESGEAEAVANRHADYFLSQAEETRAAYEAGTADLEERQRRLHDELDNLRRAVEWLGSSGEVERELRLTTAAFWALWTRASLRELDGWLVSALQRDRDADPELRAEALGAVALAASNLHERERARGYARELLAHAQERSDKRQIEWALRVLSFGEQDLAERRRLLRECERLLRELGHDSGLGWVKFLLGLAFYDEREFEAARPELEEAVEIFRRLGRRWEAMNAQAAVGYALVAAGRLAEARPISEEVLRAGVELGSPSAIVEALVGLAAVRVEEDAVAAARLLGAAQAVAATVGQKLGSHYVLDRCEEQARERLGEEFEAEREAGRKLTVEEAVRLALDEK